jgi:two-component system KDP operon response regulator KdpE
MEGVKAEVELGPTRKPAQPGRHDDRRKPLVLAVDDDPQALGYIRETIEKGGYRVVVTGEPEKVKELVEAHQPDLLLLDLLLPGTDGIELMRSLPKRSDRPVIFLSAYGRDETIAKALKLGAADYIVKPFSPTELIARIEAALRKYAETPESFQTGDLVINYEERRVELAGSPVQLTATEFDLLRILSTHAGRVVTYEQLLSSAWQMRNSGDARVVRVFIKKLRQKLGDDAKSPRYIFTVQRVGYRMARPSDQ